MDLRSYIRDVPDFPEPGIMFRDITPLLGSPEAFGAAIDLLRKDNKRIIKGKKQKKKKYKK